MMKMMKMKMMIFKGRMINMKKDLRPFIKHCMEDKEFWISGGIPTKEEYYINKLDLTEEQVAVFYDAMVSLQQLAKEINRKDDSK